MKKPIILFSLFVIVASARAQEGTDFNPKPKPEEELKKKNEISLNTAPLFRVLLGASSTESMRFSATYKRNFSPRSALRFSIMADKISNDFQNNSTWNEVIILQTDSVIVRQTIISPGYMSPHINFGYEHHFGKHLLTWFYGADLSVGYAKSRSIIQNQALHKDTTQGANTWVFAHEYRADVVSKTEKQIFSLGVSPFFGAKFPISKRFSVSAQVGVDMAFQDQNISTTKVSIIDKYRVSVFDFNENTGFLNDISLVYKF